MAKGATKLDYYGKTRARADLFQGAAKETQLADKQRPGGLDEKNATYGFARNQKRWAERALDNQRGAGGQQQSEMSRLAARAAGQDQSVAGQSVLEQQRRAAGDARSLAMGNRSNPAAASRMAAMQNESAQLQAQASARSLDMQDQLAARQQLSQALAQARGQEQQAGDIYAGRGAGLGQLGMQAAQAQGAIDVSRAQANLQARDAQASNRIGIAQTAVDRAYASEADQKQGWWDITNGIAQTIGTIT